MHLQMAREWLAQDPDPTTRAELEAVLAAGDEKALAERFAGRLEFGTAGLRGVLGAGPLRMNRVVVLQTSAGLAAYLAAELPRAAERGVVIGYDGRHMSREFAEDSARVFLGAGFRVFLTAGVVPTPLAAYAVLARGAAAGVMVTASHNPPEYNGYKVYWENGAQIIPPHDFGIAARIGAVGPLSGISLGDLEEARRGGALELLGDELFESYLAGVAALRRDPPRAALTVAYTPLHGVGGAAMRRALADAEVGALHVEPSQAEPDADFPTVRFPNPEEEGAMDRVMALGQKVGADLLLANDPDADRLAVAVRGPEGFEMLSGDELGCLLADYLLEVGGGDDRMVAASIVSSQLLGEMAAARGVAFKLTLTGFKWIANAAIAAKAEEGLQFVLGYEEALGYSVGELVRDKDGISAAVIVCELAAVEKSAGRGLRERLEDIYRRHGVYVTEQHSLVLPGLDGADQIRAHMARFRAEPPKEIGGRRVRAAHDIARGDLGLPESDVLVYFLEDGSRIIVRPSGTEPKLKSYYEVREAVATGESIGAARERARAALRTLKAAHQGLFSR